MQPFGRWKAFTVAIVGASLAVFLFFVYAGSVAGVQCGTVPASGACSLRAAMGGMDAFSDYLYGVVALLLGQIVLLSAWFLRRPR